MTELTEHPQVVTTGPVLDELAVREPHDVDLLALEGAVRRRQREPGKRERSRLRTANGQATNDAISLGHDVFERPADVGHGRDQLLEDRPHARRALRTGDR